MASIGESARFLYHFLKNPVCTGAIAPSSRHLAARMVADMDLRGAETIIEVGPGTGSFTRAILEEAGPRSRVIAVELNPEFARGLARRFPGVDVVNGSAEHLGDYLQSRGRASADSVLCSLPWAGFPLDLQKRLLEEIVDCLRPGGRFATFAYVHAFWFPAARRFKRMLDGRFRTVRTSCIVWRNVPPAVVYRGEK